MTSGALMEGDLAWIVGGMTNEEKVALLGGHRMWKSKAIQRLGIPSIVMTDGTYGVRYSIPQIDGDEAGGTDFEAFLSVVGQRADDIQTAWGRMKPATCFPNGSSFACSWDVGLARELGAALAAECRAFGVNLLLGPGINIRRTPLAGRSYEYYSEDPVLSGDIAAAVIEGLQANGVGASLKHFACNNSEVQRTTMDSVVEERALREIYLKGFERAIRKSDPWTVMSSYNRLNGVQAAENHWLLTTVLRQEWGYEGVVVSDWHGIKDRPASLQAGNDLDMPESAARKADLLEAVESGRIATETLDRACLRVLQLVRKGREGMQPETEADFAGNHELARRMAAESIVLLKNEGPILPLDPARNQTILVVGADAKEPIIQGSGCATTRPTKVDVPLDEIRKAAPAADIRFRPIADFEAGDANETLALADVEAADVVVFFGNTEVGYDGEGSDRTHLNLDDGQDALIERLGQLSDGLVVVLATPDAVVMPWLGATSAVLAAFFGGQGIGRAVADILFGKQNPCGKLTATFPTKLEHVPGFLTYPGENNRHVYSEGIHVGYRCYDARGIEPLFPFGFGLGYSRFEYSNLSVDAGRVDVDGRVTLSFDVTNAGPVDGKEIAQIYARPCKPRLIRPIRELKGFAKVALASGETKRVEVTVEGRDLCYYDPAHRRWLLDAGTLFLEVGASSRDIRLEARVDVEAPTLPATVLDTESQPFLVLAHEFARKRFRAFLVSQLELNDAEADHMMDYCAGSFLGIHKTVSWATGERISKAAMAAFLDDLNREMGAMVEPDAQRAA